MEEDVIKAMLNHIQHLEKKLNKIEEENKLLNEQLSLKKGSNKLVEVKQDLPINAYWY